ncbi:hypothetical protein D3C79_819800 [compost metagenome]
MQHPVALKVDSVIFQVPGAAGRVRPQDLDLGMMPLVFAQKRGAVENRLEPSNKGRPAVEAVFAAIQGGGQVFSQALLQCRPVMAVNRAKVAVLELLDLLDLENVVQGNGHQWYSCRWGGIAHRIGRCPRASSSGRTTTLHAPAGAKLVR